MLYLDSSALFKRYVQEIGSKDLESKIGQVTGLRMPVFTSALSYAEIHAALARKLKEGTLTPTGNHSARGRFEADWDHELSIVELKANVLRLIPRLLAKYPLKAGDAIHLASAIALTWPFGPGKKATPFPIGTIFATADKQLAQAAKKESLSVFDPENSTSQSSTKR